MGGWRRTFSSIIIERRRIGRANGAVLGAARQADFEQPADEVATETLGDVFQAFSFAFAFLHPVSR